MGVRGASKPAPKPAPKPVYDEDFAKRGRDATERAKDNKRKGR